MGASGIPRRVGLYLALVQFVFALCWVVYVIYLPRLAQQVGLGPGVVVWILMLDQLIFVASDFAMGVASDRSTRRLRRLGPMILAVTALSCVAFLLLPMATAQGSVWLAGALIVLWSITSSALRAPPLVLIGRHAAKATQPWLVGMSVFGLGLASAIAPYLGGALRDLDPRWPFALASAALVLATLGIVAAERHLAQAGTKASALIANPPRTDERAVAGAAAPWLGAMLAAALAFQVHVSINSAPLYLRHAQAADIQYLTPVFWVGFNLFLLPATLLVRRFGGPSVLPVAAGVAGIAALLLPSLTDLQMIVNLQFLVGGAWACALTSAIAVAMALGAPGRQGRFTGALASVLAFAALLRLAMVAAAWPRDADLMVWLFWLPGLGWLLVAAICWRLWPPVARASLSS